MTPDEKRLLRNRRSHDRYWRRKRGEGPWSDNTTTEPLCNMNVGDTYFYERHTLIQELQNTIGRFFRRRKWHYLTRRTVEFNIKGVRVWRVASPPPKEPIKLRRYPPRGAERYLGEWPIEP